MSFKRKWPENLEHAVVAAALDHDRDAPTVQRMVAAGELDGFNAYPVPLGTVRIWIGNARRDLRTREIATQRPADVLDVVLGQLVAGVKRDGDRYARRARRGQTKPGEAAALAKDCEMVARALKAAQEPAAKRDAAPAPTPDADFLGRLAADRAAGNGPSASTEGMH
jgi:hypothetical protein